MTSLIDRKAALSEDGRCRKQRLNRFECGNAQGCAHFGRKTTSALRESNLHGVAQRIGHAIAFCADPFAQVEFNAQVIPGGNPREVIFAWLVTSTPQGCSLGGAFSLSVLRIQDTGDAGRNGLVSGVLVGG